MKRPYLLTLALSVVFIGFVAPLAQAQTVAAKPLRLEIKANKKRTDVERTQTQSKNLAEEKWLYEVEIRNTSFSDLADIKVDYRCYKRDDKYGADNSSSKLPLKPIPGSETIATLANAATYKFSTEEVKIQKDELKGGWVYLNGSKPKIKDSLYGIWIKVLKNGEVVCEYQNPPTLKSKVQW
jgi:hypothetical protein